MWHRILIRELEKRFGPPERAELPGRADLLKRGENPQGIHALAYAYAAPFDGNVWLGHRVLLEAIRRIAREIFQREEIGRRLTCPLMHAFALVREALGEEARAWKSELVRIVRRDVLPPLRECERLTVFSSANVGYGTNHLAVELSGLTACAAAFRGDKDFETMDPGGADLVEYARAYLARFMDYMAPDGYWAETDGPANDYNTLTAAALFRCAADLGEVEKYRRHFEAVSRFHALTTFPNLRCVNITDGRNRRSRGLTARQTHAAFTPEGKALCEQMWADYERRSRGGQQIDGETLHELLTVFQARPYATPQPAQHFWAAEERTERLQAGFGFRRCRSWIAAASNCLFRPRPEAHFTLDHQNLFALYHDRFGTVVPGDNGKNDPRMATFHKNFTHFDGSPLPADQPMIKYVPGRGRLDLRQDGFHLMRDYRGFEGLLDLCVRDEATAELKITVHARLSNYPILFTLQPPLAFGGAFRDGRGREHRIREEPFRLSAADLAGEIRLPPEQAPHRFRETQPAALTIKLPSKAELSWPYSGWDCYNLKMDRYQAPEEMTVLLKIPVGPDGAILSFHIGD